MLRKLGPVLFLLILFGGEMAYAQQDTLLIDVYGDSPTRVFEGFDFNDPGYCLYATEWSFGWQESYFDTLGLFYVADSTLLNEMKRDWCFPEGDMSQ